MIDVNKVVREQFIGALDGLIYDGDPVPVYHEMNPNEDETLYIILNTQTEADSSTKASFDTTCTLLLDIVHRTDGCTYDVVDTVANSVLTTLQPTPQTSGVASTNELQIANLKRISSNTLMISDRPLNVMRRLLRYQFTVIEK
jgi:hypothetical protein